MLNEITDDSQLVVDGIIYCHAPWSSYSIYNRPQFAAFAEKYELSPVYWINVDLPLILVQKIYTEGYVSGYGEIAVIRNYHIQKVVKYRHWEDCVGLEILAAWNPPIGS